MGYRSARMLRIAVALVLATCSFGCSFARRERANTIKIGSVLPLTGPSARYGKWIQEALELAREQVNKNGGIAGNPLSLIYEDDQAQPAAAASAIQKLITVDRVPAVFGSWASSCVLAEAPIAQRAKTVLVAEALSPQIRNAGDYVFDIQPDAHAYLKTLVPFVFDQLHGRSASILYINNDFGVDQAAVFKADFARLGGQVLSEESYLPDAVDFRAQLTKIRSVRPNVLFVPGYAEIGTILKQARELGLDCKFVGSVPTENPDVIGVAGSAAEGIIYPSHFDPNSSGAAARAFQLAYTARYGRPAEGFAALAFDGLMILAGGLKQCGTDSTCLRDFLHAVKDYPGVTGPTSFDDHGGVIKPIILKTIRNGAFVRY